MSRAPAAEELAAAIAAVEAYLANERRASAAPRRGVSAWRMAYAAGGGMRGFGANASWQGRDR